MAIDSPASRRVLTIIDDFGAEREALDRRVGAISPEQWLLPTPAEPWTVADQISHLAYFDASARLAICDREAFGRHRAELFGSPGSDADLELGRSADRISLLESWRSGCETLRDAARLAAASQPQARIPWYGPDMSLASFVSARVMETWAHGQDVADALGLAPVVSSRLRHVIHLGVAARPYAFRVHGVDDPGDPVAVHTHNPSDETDVWVFGPKDAADRITGSALGLALVFTQRRWPVETDVTAEGATAELFLQVAQAFAGPPGRRPLRPSNGAAQAGGVG